MKSGVKFWTRATASNTHNQPGGFWNPDSSRREPKAERNATPLDQIMLLMNQDVFPPCVKTIVEQIRLDFLFVKLIR